jgi:hypothetical protein
LDCTDGALLNVDEYRSENNTWGKGSLTGWSQCIGIGIGSGPSSSVSARFTWNWLSSGGNVKAYPELIFGLKPGSDSTTASLPRQVNTLQALTVQYDVSSTHSGSGNTALDIWLTNTATPTGFSVPPITHEVMVWLESYGGMSPGGTFQESAAVDGVSYDVYTGDNFGAGWRYIAFKRTAGQLGSATLNIKALLDYAQSKNYLSGTEFVASVEFGNEVIAGTGDTKISQFSVTAQ